MGSWDIVFLGLAAGLIFMRCINGAFFIITQNQRQTVINQACLSC